MNVARAKTVAEDVVLGDDARRAAKLSGVAAALFVVAFLVHFVVHFAGLSGFDSFVLAVMFVAAAGGAYLNDGVLVSVALAAGPSLGFYAAAAVFEFGDLRRAVFLTMGYGVVSALVVGTAGFVVGAVARRVAA